MTTDGFLARMGVLYGPPDTPDEEAFINECRDVLKGTHPKILKKAGDIIRDEQIARRWPTPGEINAALRKAAYSVKIVTPAEHMPFSIDERVEPDERSKAIVAELAASFKARIEASKEKIEHKPLADVSRDAFEKMQRESPNVGLHQETGLPRRRAR